MMVTLPWPPKELSPNARPHHFAKAKQAKIYREAAYWLTKATWLYGPSWNPTGDDSEIMLSIVFHPPDKRRRDLDSMLTSIKNGLDGFADAIEINDYRFALTIRRGVPIEGGRVIIDIVDDTP